MTDSRSGHSARGAGFTLLEIMVALAVGGVALSSIYAVGAASTRHFREQQRVSAAQTSLRSAMDQLKRDFQRAGFLSTANVRMPNESCTLPGSPLDDASGAVGTGRLAAISSVRESVAIPLSLDPDALNPWATVDQVMLVGNYSTSGEYPGISVGANRVTISIPVTSQSFQRDFGIWSGANAGQCNLAVFSNTFAVGRLVRLHTQTNRVFFSTVQAVTCPDAVTATVTMVNPVPTSCAVDGGWIAPVNVISIQAADAAGDEVSRANPVNRVSVLRRTEVDPSNKAAPLALVGNGVPLDDRSILDYLVKFRVRFMQHNGAPNIVNFAAATAANVNLTPERVRGVIIDLATRTAEQEPEFDATQYRQGLAFKVFPTPGGARVRSLHAELLIQNVAYRGF